MLPSYGILGRANSGGADDRQPIRQSESVRSLGHSAAKTRAQNG